MYGNPRIAFQFLDVDVVGTFGSEGSFLATFISTRDLGIYQTQRTTAGQGGTFHYQRLVIAARFTYTMCAGSRGVPRGLHGYLSSVLWAIGCSSRCSAVGGYDDHSLSRPAHSRRALALDKRHVPVSCSVSERQWRSTNELIQAAGHSESNRVPGKTEGV